MIAGLIEEGVTDPHVIAREALTWVHEQSHHDTEHAAEREEMTPEETLARIRLLLDDGSYSRLHQMVDEQAQQIVALENRAEQAERKAAEAMDTLQAFRELAAELTDGERKEQEAG